MTTNQKKIIGFMQANPGEFFASEIAEGCGLEEKSVRPILTGLSKTTKDRAEVYVEVSAGTKTVTDKDGNEVVRTYKKYALTEAGAAVEIDD